MQQSWSYRGSGSYKEWKSKLDGPALEDVPLEELDDYLARKLDWCSIVFDIENAGDLPKLSVTFHYNKNA